MELIITSKEELLEEAYKIEAFLDITMSDNPEEAVQRGNDLTAYLGRTTKMLADAKYHLNETTKRTCSIYSRKRQNKRVQHPRQLTGW